MQQNIKIGINPLTWTNDDLPSLGGETSLQQCLREGKQAGFQGFELGQKFPREASALQAALGEFQLELASGWFSGSIYRLSVEQEIERLRPHVALLKALGCEVLIYCDTTGSIQGTGQPLSHRPIITEGQWTGFAEKLSAVAEFVGSEGLKLAYHHHMGTLVESSSDVDKLMEKTSSAVYLLLDTGHLWYAGGDPVEVAQRYGARICHVHCKDIRPQIATHTLNRDRSFIQGVLDGVFAVPGHGCIDFLNVFKALNQHSYQGWLIVEAEQDPVVAPPLAVSTDAFINLSGFAGQAGLMTL